MWILVLLDHFRICIELPNLETGSGNRQHANIWTESSEMFYFLIDRKLNFWLKNVERVSSDWNFKYLLAFRQSLFNNHRLKSNIEPGNATMRFVHFCLLLTRVIKTYVKLIIELPSSYSCKKEYLFVNRMLNYYIHWKL